MATVLQPCDAGVIRGSKASAPCKPSSRPWLCSSRREQAQGHIAFADFEPRPLAGRRGRDAIHSPKSRAFVLLKRDASAALFSDLRLQVLDNPGGHLVLRGSGGPRGKVTPHRGRASGRGWRSFRSRQAPTRATNASVEKTARTPFQKSHGPS